MRHLPTVKFPSIPSPWGEGRPARDAFACEAGVVRGNKKGNSFWVASPLSAGN